MALSSIASVKQLAKTISVHFTIKFWLHRSLLVDIFFQNWVKNIDCDSLDFADIILGIIGNTNYAGIMGTFYSINENCRQPGSLTASSSINHTNYSSLIASVECAKLPKWYTRLSVRLQLYIASVRATVWKVPSQECMYHDVNHCCQPGTYNNIWWITLSMWE